MEKVKGLHVCVVCGPRYSTSCGGEMKTLRNQSCFSIALWAIQFYIPHMEVLMRWGQFASHLSVYMMDGYTGTLHSQYNRLHLMVENGSTWHLIKHGTHGLTF